MVASMFALGRLDGVPVGYDQAGTEHSDVLRVLLHRSHLHFSFPKRGIHTVGSKGVLLQHDRPYKEFSLQSTTLG